MNILVVGINFRQTALEIRECLSFSSSEQIEALKKIRSIAGVNECVLISTCNRTEVYIYSEDPHFDSSSIEKLLCEIKGLEAIEMKKHFYIYSSSKAVKHLFKVSSGLDSQVIGEDQILGQVKEAFERAFEAGCTSSVLNTLFRDGITVAKRVKTYTELSKNSISIGTLAVKLLSEIYNGKLESKSALVIGAGKIGSIALKNLASKGIEQIFITNRTHGKAEDISKIYNNILTVDYDARYSVINKCDIIISSTMSPHYTITMDLLEKSVSDYKERVFIDLAVPRDIDVAIKELSWVRYFNIDDLKVKVDKGIDKRLLEVSKVEEIINEYTSEYIKWYEFRGVLPVVKDIQRFTEGMLSEKINQTLSRLKSSSTEDKEIVKASMKSAVNEILNKFIYSVRENGTKDDIAAYFRCLGEVIKDEQE